MLSNRLAMRISQPQFIKLFKRVAGLVNYVARVCLSHSFRLLKEISLRIAEVAFQTGFSDQSHLDRRFKAAFGQVPNAVRKQLNS